MIVVPIKIEKLNKMKFEDLIKEKHKIMKKIISLEKQIYLETSNEVQDPEPKMVLNNLNEELNLIESILEPKDDKIENKGIFI